MSEQLRKFKQIQAEIASISHRKCEEIGKRLWQVWYYKDLPSNFPNWKLWPSKVPNYQCL